MEVDLIREVGLLEGSTSFNPWVRELPDPLTRVSWHGAARLAPKRAKALEVKDGDEITIKVGKVSLRMPVRILPGQHPDVYCRSGGAMDWSTAMGGHRSATLIVLPNGARDDWCPKVWRRRFQRRVFIDPLAIFQPHASHEGREIIHQVRSAKEAVHVTHHGGGHHDLWPEHKYETHWEMVIDLDKCTGCSACVISCQAENNLPVVGPEEMRRHRDMHWLRIDRYFQGDEDNPEVLFEPMLCAQCDNAPCETVCPVSATVHSADGLNQQAYNRCVGTRYCANNCPL